MPELIEAQLEGARFLAARDAALLADMPGFGKSAQVVVACDILKPRRILVVTTASARENWRHEFALWSREPREAVAWLNTKTRPIADGVTIVAWSNVIYKPVYEALAAVEWDVLVLDESHYAKSVEAKRTKVVYDVLAPRAKRTWCLTGTPVPNAPNDLFPMMKALFPEALGETPGYYSFLNRYCVTKTRYISGRSVDVVIGGRNERELADRMRPHILRRKTEGLPPIRYSTYLLDAGRLAEEGVDRQAVIDAAETGSTADLDMHLGTLRRLTGELKAASVLNLVREELENGLDKIVLFAWHKDVINTLSAGLAPYGAVKLDGATPAADRQGIVERFQNDPATRVFVGQIQAAGEAITLTAANQVLFVEVSFVPKDMAQAVRRILRRGQTRPCLCRVAALAGSIDEALMRIVTRKVETIRSIMEEE